METKKYITAGVPAPPKNLLIRFGGCLGRAEAIFQASEYKNKKKEKNEKKKKKKMIKR